MFKVQKSEYEGTVQAWVQAQVFIRWISAILNQWFCEVVNGLGSLFDHQMSPLRGDFGILTTVYDVLSEFIKP
jgi:hypothetical protein